MASAQHREWTEKETAVLQSLSDALALLNREYPQLAQRHLHLLVTVALDEALDSPPRTIQELAPRAGFGKDGASRPIMALGEGSPPSAKGMHIVGMGLVATIDDPSEYRAKNVLPTAKGRRLLRSVCALF